MTDVSRGPETPQPEPKGEWPGLGKMLLHPFRLYQAKLREAKKSKDRSPEWPRVRDEHLREHPECEACGSRKNLQVHHIRPFHLFPELELSQGNLITLCMSLQECHLSLGHGGSWVCWDPEVLFHVSQYRHAPIESRRKVRFKIEEAAKLGRLREKGSPRHHPAASE